MRAPLLNHRPRGYVSLRPDVVDILKSVVMEESNVTLVHEYVTAMEGVMEPVATGANGS